MNLKDYKEKVYLLANTDKTYAEIAVEVGLKVSQVKYIIREGRKAGKELNIKKEVSSGEMLTYHLLKKCLPGFKIIKQYSLGQRLRLDFYVPQIKMGIEYQGVQHNKYVGHFHKSTGGKWDSQRRDERKKDLCNRQKILLIYLYSHEDIIIENIWDLYKTAERKFKRSHFNKEEEIVRYKQKIPSWPFRKLTEEQKAKRRSYNRIRRKIKKALKND